MHVLCGSIIYVAQRMQLCALVVACKCAVLLCWFWGAALQLSADKPLACEAMSSVLHPLILCCLIGLGGSRMAPTQ
jgi:ABC-type Mn2+/Zn2+ transport system permease subunit